MKVIIKIPGALGERVSAPEVRGRAMARELAREHEVVVAANCESETLVDGLRVIPAGRQSLLAAARAADVVICTRIPPYLYGALGDRRPLFVADMYNPAEVEQVRDDGRLGSRLTRASIVANDDLQLRFADIVLCAIEAQRSGFAPRIAALANGNGRRPILRIVPFGLDNEDPPPATERPIRQRFPNIRDDDVVVLWWGNVWRWFDAETALQGFARVAQDNPRVKLVLTGGRAPRSETRVMDKTEAARELASSLGLLGRGVFFLDDWIPHSRRHLYLQEADLGLTLHRDTREKEVAARGRYLDYLWTRLPCLLASGDELSDRFAAGGFATTIPPGNVDATATALRTLVEDARARCRAREAAAPIREEFRWCNAVRPLLEALRDSEGREAVRSGSRATVLRGLAGVGLRRLAANGHRRLQRR